MCSFIIIGYFSLSAIIQVSLANPLNGDVKNTGTRNFLEETDFKKILMDIETRLKNLDSLYVNQLTPTLDMRMEHFQNRISGMEIKLLRIETLLTSKLDRMSDNISSRHFRDDMVQTDMFRKIETAYDGITHRLTYMDRKNDGNLSKLLGKIDSKFISTQPVSSTETICTKEVTESNHFEKLLNEYATKVSDLGDRVLKIDEKLVHQLNKLEKTINFTKIETQNGLRSLNVQMAKLTPKENEFHEDLSNIDEKLDVNFKEIIGTQKNFMENCHRLQMDESHLENEISDILNKLIDNFALTSKEQYQLLRKIEGNLLKHDINHKKGMHQVNGNILKISDQYKKSADDFDQHLTDLEKTLIRNAFQLEQTIQQHEKKFENFAMNQTKNLEAIKNSTEKFLENFHNLTPSLSERIEIISQIVNENHDHLRKILNKSLPGNKTDFGRNFTDLDHIIRTVFFVNTTKKSDDNTDNGCLDMDIDVRFDSEKNNCTKDSIIFPDDIKQEDDCSGLNIDVRYNENGEISNKCKNSTNTASANPTTEVLNETTTEFFYPPQNLISDSQENLNITKNSTEYIDLEELLN